MACPRNHMSKPLKVAQIVLSLNTGGLEYVVINLLKRLDRTRFEPVVYCLDKPGNLACELEPLGIPVRVLGGPSRTARLLSLTGWLRREKTAVVHTHNHRPLMYGTLAGRLARVPAIINTKHGAYVFSYMRYLSRLADAIVAVSEDGRRITTELEGAPPRKTLVIHNGIEVERFHQPDQREPMRASLGLAAGDRVLGMVSRLSAHKDHTTLLKSLAAINRESQRPAKLLLVGGGELEDDLKELAASLGVAEQTIFLGDRRDVPELLAAMDIFVLSTTTEGVSLTLLEAMAAGLPVVASQVGGTPEVVVPDQTGLLVPAGDEAALTRALADLLGDPARAVRMGQKGLKRVEDQFSLKAMTQSYQDLYSRLLARKGFPAEAVAGR